MKLNSSRKERASQPSTHHPHLHPSLRVPSPPCTLSNNFPRASRGPLVLEIIDAPGISPSCCTRHPCDPYRFVLVSVASARISNATPLLLYSIYIYIYIYRGHIPPFCDPCFFSEGNIFSVRFSLFCVIFFSTYRTYRLTALCSDFQKEKEFQSLSKFRRNVSEAKFSNLPRFRTRTTMSYTNWLRLKMTNFPVYRIFSKVFYYLLWS